MTQGDTRVAHLAIRTILKGESPEQSRSAGADTLAQRFDKLFISAHACLLHDTDTVTQRFDKLFISAHACLLHDTDTLTQPFTIPLIRKIKS